MKIYIYYRHTSNHIVRNRPSWFSFENCWKNLLNTTYKKENINITLALDGDINNDFTKNYKDRFTLFPTDYNSSLISYRELLKHIKGIKMDKDDLIYFVENDYLHNYNSKDILLEGFKLGAPFVSLYDHPDKYLSPDKGGNPYCEGGAEDTRVYLTDSVHWKITNSTTMTFAAKVSTLKLNEGILRKHTAGTHPDDFQMFLELRQTNQLLITPIPGYSTHGETAWLSPLTNWNKI